MTSLNRTGLTDDELTTARAALHAHYQRHLGRVGLRGFLDGDGASAAFAVDDLFEPLDALQLDEHGAATPHAQAIGAAVNAVSAVSADDAGVLGSIKLLTSAAPLMALLDRPRHPVSLILGAPGAGKSFFLRWCALTASRDDRFLGVDHAIPVHVSLAMLRNNALPDLAELATAALRDAGLAIADVIATEAAAGRVIFLLDGLDETGAAVATVVDAIAELARHYPRARILVTSRPSVVAISDLALVADRFQLEGLSDDAIVTLLVSWCELHAAHRGDDVARATSDGGRLARNVLASPGLHDLAASPLLAGFIALLHRNGVAVPDRRIELCDAVIALLVARGNQARATAPAPAPIDTAALLGLLGPIALTLIESGADGAVEDDILRRQLDRELARGTVAGLGDTDAALAFLRDALGLVVDQGPGVAGFTHRTLLDVLAAHELARTDALETLITTPACFTAPWHEAVRLALGVVGTVRADEARLTTAIGLLIEHAHGARANPTVLVPDLLGAVLVDDPGLTPALATAICAELVPAWWFDGTPAIRGEYAGIALADRILNGPWQRALASAFQDRYRTGWGEVRYGSGGLRARLSPMGLLRRLGCSVPLLLCEALVAEMIAARDDDGPRDGAARFTPLTLITPPEHGSPWSFVAFAFHTAGLTTLLRKGAGGLFFAAMASESEVGPGWTVLEGDTGERMIGRRLDAGRDDAAIDMTGSLHVAIDEHPDPALLPNVLAAWHELARRYPDGPRPPASLEDAVARYGATTPIN